MIDLSVNQIIDPAIEVEVSQDGKDWMKRLLMSIDHRLDFPYMTTSRYPSTFKHARLIQDEYMTMEEAMVFCMHRHVLIRLKDKSWRTNYDFIYDVKGYEFIRTSSDGKMIEEPKKFFKKYLKGN